MTPKLRFKKEDGSAYPEWVKQPLEEIVEFSKGNVISKGDLTEDGVPTVLYGELYTRYGHVIDEVHSRTDKTFLNPRVSEGNEVLIPSSGETAEDIAVASALTVPGVLLGGDMNVLRTSSVNNRYLSFLLNTKHKRDLQLGAQGKTVVHLYSASIKKIVAEIADNEEQAKIADFLTALDARITDQRDLVELLEERKMGMLQRVFSQQVRFVDDEGHAFPEWESEHMGEIGEYYNGLSGKTKEDFGIGESRFIIYRNVFKNPVADPEMTESVVVNPGERQNVVKKGDILFTQSSETLREIGMSSLWDHENEAYLNSFCFGYRVADQTLAIPRYLAYLFRTAEMRKRIMHEGQGITRINISSNRLKNMLIPLPHPEEQQKIADFFTALDEEIEASRSLLNDYIEQKNGMLQQLFT